MDIVNEFNTTCNIFIDLLYSFTQDSDLSFYKKAMTQLVKADKLKMIEQFTIHCLIHNEYIQNKDFSYFMNIFFYYINGCISSNKNFSMNFFVN